MQIDIQYIKINSKKVKELKIVMDQIISTRATESNIHYNGEISLSHRSRKRIREAKKKARPGKLYSKAF